MNLEHLSNLKVDAGRILLLDAESVLDYHARFVTLKIKQMVGNVPDPVLENLFWMNSISKLFKINYMAPRGRFELPCPGDSGFRIHRNTGLCDLG